MKIPGRCVFVLFIIGFAVSWRPVFSQNKGLSQQLSEGSRITPEYLPDEVLVIYKPHVSQTKIQSFQSSKGFTPVGTFYATHKKDKVVHTLKIKAGKTVEETVDELKKNPDVEHVQPNYIYRFYAIPNDPDFSKLWGMRNTGQSVNGVSGTQDADIDADKAWDIYTYGAKIAVIDTGALRLHPDLLYWSNPDDPIDGIDNDGNGYVDDRYGWDFFDNDNDVTDYVGHGSHVAGTIAAYGNDGIGVTGVCQFASVIPLKIAGVQGFATNDKIIPAINYAVNKGARVINASWGGGGGYNGDLLYQAIKAAGDAGVLFVAAAGNGGYDGIGDNNDIYPHYPSSYALDNIISVAATDQNDNLTSFSNYGVSKVHVAAPGNNIYSTVATYSEGNVTVYNTGFDTSGERSGWWNVGSGNTWAFTNSKSASPSYSYTDSPSGNYANNLVSTRTLVCYDVPITYVKDSKYILQFKVNYELENGYDFLDIVVSLDKTNWIPLSILGNSFRITGTSNNSFVLKEYDITELMEAFGSSVYFGFGITSDYSYTYDGVYIDDINIIRKPMSVNTYTYEYMDGTSMAAPHVSGVAGLILGKYPDLNLYQVKSSILNSVDKKSSLSGKVSTGGRINAYKALVAASCLPEPTNVSGTALSTSSIKWQWSSSGYGRNGFMVISSTMGAISGVISKYDSSWTADYKDGPNSPHQIYVMSYSTGVSDYSELVAFATMSALSSAVYTLANPPASPRIVSASKSDGIKLSWDANGNPLYSTRYKIDRASSSAMNFSTIAGWSDVLIDTWYIDKYINVNTTYYYRIAAYNDDRLENYSPLVISTCVIENKADPTNPNTEPLISAGAAGIQYVGGSGSYAGYMHPGEKVNIYFVPVFDGTVNMTVVSLDGSDVYSVGKYCYGGQKDYFEFRGEGVKASGIYPVIISGGGIRQIKKICVIK